MTPIIPLPLGPGVCQQIAAHLINHGLGAGSWLKLCRKYPVLLVWGICEAASRQRRVPRDLVELLQRFEETGCEWLVASVPLGESVREPVPDRDIQTPLLALAERLERGIAAVQNALLADVLVADAAEAESAEAELAEAELAEAELAEAESAEAELAEAESAGEDDIHRPQSDQVLWWLAIRELAAFADLGWPIPDMPESLRWPAPAVARDPRDPRGQRPKRGPRSGGEDRLETLYQQFLDQSPGGSAASEAAECDAVASRIRRDWAAEPGGQERLSLTALAGQLARLQLLESRFAEVLEREKLESLRQLAYGASHELNNPLANIATRAQALLRDEEDPQRRRRLATINAQAFRAHEMISDLMLFAKPPKLQLQRCELAELLGRVLGELAEEAAEQGTRLQCHLDDQRQELEADPEYLAEALKAMCRNSLEAVGAGGAIELTSRCHWKDQEPGMLRIEVSDTGPGIPPEARRHLFDPFYSGREAGRGLGMGLSKCWRIVQQHGGRIDVASLPRGARFTIRLPLRPLTRAAG